VLRRNHGVLPADVTQLFQARKVTLSVLNTTTFFTRDDAHLGHVIGVNPVPDRLTPLIDRRDRSYHNLCGSAAKLPGDRSIFSALLGTVKTKATAIAASILIRLNMFRVDTFASIGRLV